MRTMTRAIVVLMTLCVSVAPVAADIIPTTLPGDTERSHRRTLEQRLVQIGVHRAEAQKDIANLPAADAAYFASVPHTLQFVGQSGPETGQSFFSGESYNMWYETAGGISFLVLVGIGIILAVDEGDED